MKVFINYRRDDAAAHARLLYDRLAARFGEDNVFLDVVTLNRVPGKDWLDEIRSQSSAAVAFLALIGGRWAGHLRSRAGVSDPGRDEIETALRTSQVQVIPILLDDAQMPTEQQVPYALRPLLRKQAASLRLGRLDADVRELLERLDEVASARGTSTDDGDQPEHDQRLGTSTGRGGGTTYAPPPPADHYDEVVKLMLDEGSLVVPFIGPGANSSDRDWAWNDVECGYLPDANELATYLARKLDLDLDPLDLARASQYVWELRPGDLYGTLRKTLTGTCPPASVHRFFAQFPRLLERLGLPKRYHLIVTTNYDDALERAFDEENEPYDLAVYMASGPNKGKFVHVRHDDEPTEGKPEIVVVDTPNTYREFPFNTFDPRVLERSVIVKIHGAVDTNSWRNNYVITEDDYIDYLSQSTIESIVPLQLRDKLTYDSQLLFLGYTMRDWNLRVFMQRMFGQHVPNNSWAINRDLNRLDATFWKNMSVDVFAAPLAEYVDELAAHLARLAPTPASA